jgi:AcrR family transcriptional regulator
LTRKPKVIIVYIVPRKPPKKQAYHHGNLRQAMVDASLQAIAELGPEAFTLREAARRAGVSPAAPYRHFADKDALLAAVAAEAAARLQADVLAAQAVAPPDPVSQFRALGIAYVRFAVAHPAHYRVINMPGVISHVPAEVQAREDEHAAAQRAALAELQAAGQISSAPLDDLLLTANCLIYGLSRLLVDGHKGFTGIDPEGAERLATAVTAVFGAGLLPRAEPPDLTWPPQSASERKR